MEERVIQELEGHMSLFISADSTAFATLTHKVCALMKVKDKTQSSTPLDSFVIVSRTCSYSLCY